MSFEIATIWQPLAELPKPKTDRERHELFAAFLSRVLVEHTPWMLPLLDAADAVVMAAPGKFTFTTKAEPGVWHEIPEIGRLIVMTPWQEDEEITQ